MIDEAVNEVQGIDDLKLLANAVDIVLQARELAIGREISPNVIIVALDAIIVNGE